MEAALEPIMKLSGDAIIFEDVLSLETFYTQLDLQGVLRLSEDLKDNSDKVLIKADVPLKPGVFEKLREIRGSYQEKFSVRITSELSRSISAFLANHALHAIDEWSFFKRLYAIEGHRYQSYIRNAFRNRRIAVTCFILMHRSPARYTALISQALLTLAIVMYRFLQIRHVHINAFLAGLLMEIGDVDGSLSRDAAQEGDALNHLKRKSADLAGSLGASKTVADTILAQEAFTELASELPEASSVAPSSGVSIADFLISEGKEASEESAEGGEGASSPESEAAVLQIAEALKFSRYILFLRERLGNDEHAAEEISYRSAYNAKKGHFSLKVVDPILRIFKEYELEIRCMMKVAELEQRCLYLPSAWAYPKPRATQMICRLHKTECPKLKPGWDLTVVSPAEAYGWIGMTLEPGRYLKCELEDELKGIFALIKKT